MVHHMKNIAKQSKNVLCPVPAVIPSEECSLNVSNTVTSQELIVEER